ncbi:MAG: type II and III secretion system protein [Candidatus Cloacimonas sp.]|jgi:type IV pilus assembly protein PilQ|nr:type II and III secretion system protein [Candidatus Cloacimonas sp.]
MRYNFLIVAMLLLLLVVHVSAQVPDKSKDTISISASTHINEAVQILETFSMKEMRKKMINLSSYNSTINIPINNLPWERALELILLQNNLIRKDNVGYISIEDVPRLESAAAVIPDEPLVIMAKGKLVRIKAVAMLADKSYMRSLGIDWSTVFNGKVSINAGFAGTSQVVSPMNLAVSGTADLGKYTVDVTTLIKAIEANQKGSIIAKPNILVASGKTGFIQVGQDISIRTKDEAGNTSDNFFKTGIIMDVSPTVVVVDGQEVIHLILSVERSNGVPSAVSTVISTSKSTTELVLFNNEETVIGGLYDTDETKARSGVPILKDLPWWVFGIRYLTGYDSYEKKDRELVITIQAEIVDSAVERMIKAKSAGVME